MIPVSCFPDLAARQAAFETVDLYPVISPEFTNNRPVLDILQGIARGGARIVQLRCKHASKLELYQLAVEARKIANQYKILLIIDDHLDVAMLAGADGVHLGQDDLPFAEAAAAGTGLLVGASTHNLEEIRIAQKSQISYLNVGPVYPTNTKEVGYDAVGVDLLKQLVPHITKPFSVMGGIKERHLPELLAAGARHIAMVTEITQADNVEERTRTLRRCFGS